VHLLLILTVRAVIWWLLVPLLILEFEEPRQRFAVQQKELQLLEEKLRRKMKEKES
jgi:hypothetical protein